MLNARVRAVSLLAALAGSAIPTAHADTYGYYNGNHDCYMFVHSMPDFDQKRDSAPGILGLPADSDGDGGAMFCVPTAATDLLGYVNRHGYPNAYGPGVADFESNSVNVYNSVTSVIATMGTLMGTDADDGTSGSDNIRSQIQGVLDQSQPGLFDVYHFGLQEDWCPNTWNMAQYALAGGVVMFCYGRWFHDGAALTDRDGGHCVALTRVDHRPWVPDYTGFIGFANPSNSSITTTQAPFFEQTESISNDLFFRNGEAIIMSQINFDIDDPDDTRWRIIDSVYFVYPREGFTNWPNTDGITNWGFAGGSISGEIVGRTWSTPNGLDVRAFALQPDRIHLAMLTDADPASGAPGVLYVVNTLNDEITEIATSVDPRSLVFGRDQRLYALLGTELVCYDLNQRIAEQSRVGLPAGMNADAIAYDDSAHELVVVAASGGMLARYPAHLNGTPSFNLMPTGTSLGTDLCMDVSPVDGAIWIADRDNGRVSEFEYDGAGNLVRDTTFTASPLGGISISRENHVYASINGVIVEMAPDPNGRYVEVPDAHLAGLRAGSQLCVTRGRTNFDPALHSGPGWSTFPADEVEAGPEAPPCRVDYAQPFGTLDFFDVAHYLALFSEHNPDADFAAPYGTFDFFDIAAFLAEFSSGCP